MVKYIGRISHSEDIANKQYVDDQVRIALTDQEGFSEDIQAHFSNTSNPHKVTKSQVGLGNVDNTSDASKPVSIAVKSALDGKADKSQVLTNVPTNAKFTDTTYTAGTGINITGNVISGTDGDSSVEVTQARVDASGHTNATLKERLDNEHNEVTTQLAQKAKQDDLVVERARIDSLATLSEGSTTGDAELIDARVGADGITYDNAGGAIRGQIDKINNDLVAHKLDYVSERAEDKLEVATFKEDYTAQFNEGFPSQANDLMDNRTYTIKLQLSSEGNPQLISKEVI